MHLVTHTQEEKNIALSKKWRTLQNDTNLVERSQSDGHFDTVLTVHV